MLLNNIKRVRYDFSFLLFMAWFKKERKKTEHGGFCGYEAKKQKHTHKKKNFAVVSVSREKESFLEPRVRREFRYYQRRKHCPPVHINRLV